MTTPNSPCCISGMVLVISSSARSIKACFISICSWSSFCTRLAVSSIVICGFGNRLWGCCFSNILSILASLALVVIIQLMCSQHSPGFSSIFPSTFFLVMNANWFPPFLSSSFFFSMIMIQGTLSLFTPNLSPSFLSISIQIWSPSPGGLPISWLSCSLLQAIGSTPSLMK